METVMARISPEDLAELIRHQNGKSKRVAAKYSSAPHGQDSEDLHALLEELGRLRQLMTEAQRVKQEMANKKKEAVE